MRNFEGIFNEIVQSQQVVIVDTGHILYYDYAFANYPVYIKTILFGHWFFGVSEYKLYEIYISGKLFRKIGDYERLFRWVHFYLRMKGEISVHSTH